MAEVASVIPIFTGNSSFSDLPAGKGRVLPLPARPVRYKPVIPGWNQGERLRTLFSRILFNSGVVDRFLGGVCEIYHRNRNKQLETMKV